MRRIQLIVTAALKAKRTWDRVPPARREQLVEGAKTTVRTHGPVVARKVADTARAQGPVVAKRVADTARAQGPVVAKRVADTARTQGPVLARRIADAIERARKGA
jgi:hypothetical protein